MTVANKIRYVRVFRQVIHEGGESEMNYIKIFQNTEAFSVSLGNIYSEYQLMQIFLDKFCQDGKYSAQIASHRVELRREGNLLIKNIYLFHP